MERQSVKPVSALSVLLGKAIREAPGSIHHLTMETMLTGEAEGEEGL